MPARTYPFIRFQDPDGQVDERARTWLPVLISNPSTGRATGTWGLLDTGADSCLFPARIATSLGHKLKGPGVKLNVTSGIEQTEVVTYKHSFRIGLLSPDRRSIVWRSRRLQIDCAESDPPVILGVDDFLARFRVTVDYVRRTVRLQW